MQEDASRPFQTRSQFSNFAVTDARLEVMRFFFIAHKDSRPSPDISRANLPFTVKPGPSCFITAFRVVNTSKMLPSLPRVQKWLKTLRTPAFQRARPQQTGPLDNMLTYLTHVYTLRISFICKSIFMTTSWNANYGLCMTSPVIYFIFL